MSTTTYNRTEADAVAEIAAQITIAHELTSAGDVVTVADGPGKTRVVDLEPYGLNPRRAIASRTVYDAASFVAYLHRHETAATEAYADVQRARVVGILDSHQASDSLVEDDARPGTPGWQGHLITLQLTQSPAWLAWAKHDGVFLPQDEPRRRRHRRSRPVARLGGATTGVRHGGAPRPRLPDHLPDLRRNRRNPVTSSAPAELTVTPKHQASLEQWHAALAKAVRDRAFEAVPVILVRMARDGWGHEAEEARRQMVAAAEARL